MLTCWHLLQPHKASNTFRLCYRTACIPLCKQAHGWLFCLPWWRFTVVARTSPPAYVCACLSTRVGGVDIFDDRLDIWLMRASLHHSQFHWHVVLPQELKNLLLCHLLLALNTSSAFVSCAVQEKQQLEKETGLKIVEAGVSDVSYDPQKYTMSVYFKKEQQGGKGSLVYVHLLCFASRDMNNWYYNVPWHSNHTCSFSLAAKH